MAQELLPLGVSGMLDQLECEISVVTRAAGAERVARPFY
jgi:hypothetical protein